MLATRARKASCRQLGENKSKGGIILAFSSKGRDFIRSRRDKVFRFGKSERRNSSRASFTSKSDACEGGARVTKLPRGVQGVGGEERCLDWGALKTRLPKIKDMEINAARLGATTRLA